MGSRREPGVAAGRRADRHPAGRDGDAGSALNERGRPAPTEAGSPAPVDPWSSGPARIELLVCPRCRGDLVELPEALGCAACALRYPVVDGVPWMTEERARPWVR